MKYTKLNNAFKALRKHGYIARQNFECCMSCGFAEADRIRSIREQKGEDIKGIVFYHEQEDKRDNDLHLAWEGNGYEIAGIFATHGIDVEWNGDPQWKIRITNYINK